VAATVTERAGARRAVVVGLDAAIAGRWLAHAAAGRLPAFADLVARGTVARNCLVPFPTLTLTNWTTVSTGATPAVHRITDYHLHRPGEGLNMVRQAYDEAAQRAERLWTAWARAGASSVVVNYPGAWPPSVERGLQLAGHGLDANEWRTGLGYSWGDWLVTLAGCDLLSTEGDPLACEPEDGLVFPVRFRRAKVPVRGSRRWLVDSSPSGVRIGFEGGDALAEVAVGEWSPVLRIQLESEEGTRAAAFRVKLLEHDHAAGRVRLFVTPLCESGAGVSPPEWGERLTELPGLPLPMREVWEAFDLGWIDGETLLELEEMEHERISAAIEAAGATIDWSLLMLHEHGPDFFCHSVLNDVDPATQPDPVRRRWAEDLELRLYQSIDRMLGRIVAAAGPEAVVVVVSDHGAIPSGPWFNPAPILEEAGLLTYAESGGEPGWADFVTVDPRPIDWSRTKAVPQRSAFVYVNVRGRDPDGVVEPGEEYEAVCEEVIRLLLAYVDPATGRRPVSLALHRRDAPVLGLADDDDIGDVIYAVEPGYGAGHGQHLPTVESGVGSLKALFVITGPGVRAGAELARRVGLEDIAPTLSYLLGLPVPVDADGGVVYQALEDPDGPAGEARTLRERYEKLKNAYERTMAITHSYTR